MINKKGQSLLEVIIAIGLVSIVLLALVSLSTKSVANNTVSKEKNQAARFSQEAVEWLRQERDHSWVTLSTNAHNNSTWCLQTLAWNNAGNCSSEPIANTVFERQVTFTQPQSDIIEVAVVTKWQEGGHTHESRSETILTKWQ